MKQRNDGPCQVDVRHLDHGGLNLEQKAVA